MGEVIETSASDGQAHGAAPLPKVSLGELTWAFCRIAAASFGGPVGQIAVMHRIVVDEKKWIDEERFGLALNFCMLLPGPEAQQLATYIGWMLHKVRGGLIAGTLFILPGFVAMLAASLLYVYYKDAMLVSGLFFGLRPAVIAIVLQAGYRLAKRSLVSAQARWLALISFLAMFVFGVPFPIVIAIGALVGVLTFPKASIASSSNVAAEREPYHWSQSVKTLVIGGTLWIGPIVAVALLLGNDSIWVEQGWLFGQTALISFGGAYSVLSYIQQQAVVRYEWLTAKEMLDGLGLGESTPGPLVMVVQFVGFIGAYRNPGSLSPLTAGILGAVVTTWVTFVPCFVWIFLGAPHVERLQRAPRLRAALAGITSVVVGVMASLALHFLLHTWFSDLEPAGFIFAFPVPNLFSSDPFAIVITLGCLFILLVRKAGLGHVLAVGCIIGILLPYLCFLGV